MARHDSDPVERRLRERARGLMRPRSADPPPEPGPAASADASDALRDRARRAPAKARHGTCADCGRAIAAARLEAIPGAVRCIDCQRRAEGL